MSKPETKRCPRCKQTKRTTDFGLNRALPDGLSFYCLACKRTKQIEVNARRRDKIRAWKRAHSTPCVDCGGETSTNGSPRHEPHRCDLCRKRHDRERAVDRSRQMLALRADGLFNYEIAERFGCTPQAVANALSRDRLRRYGLLSERVTSPYYMKEAA